jgi:hypothetical protein
MNRRGDLDAFYALLAELRERVGGCRRLAECTGKSGWPERGIYFFFTKGELREDGQTLRVVRVGTHAVTATSKTTLWHRLRAHRGVLGAGGIGGGNHRGSIFRKRVGAALLRTTDVPEALRRTWGVGSSAPRSVSDVERPLEAEASKYIGSMPFLWLAVPDPASPNSDRGILEQNSIALLSNFERPPIDRPSSLWLGLHSGQRTISESGLWNTDYVADGYERTFLELLSSHVRAVPRRA